MKTYIAVIGMIVLLVAGFAGGFYVGRITYPVPEYKGLTGEFLIPIIEATASPHIPPVVEILNEEVNAYLKSIGANFTIKFVYDQSEGSADRFAAQVQEYHTAGAKVIIGSPWSSHCMAAKSYADEHHVLIFSMASSSPLLAIPNDYIFRLNTDDRYQARLLADLYKEFGIKAFVSLYVGDAWGRGLIEALRNEIANTDIVEYYSIEYAPETNFITEMALLNEKVSEAVKIYGKDKVAVEFIGFATVQDVPAMQQAANYPLLLEVPWITADAIWFSVALDQYKDYAVKVGFLSPQWASALSDNYYAFVEKYKKKTGFEPENYAVNTYDCGWIITFCILHVQKYDADAIRQVLPFICSRYFGARGWTKLNEAGDLAYSNYVIGAVVDEENPHWENVGFYDSVSRTFTWFVDPKEFWPPLKRGS